MAIEQYHFDFMAEAIAEAKASIAQGGLPIGAVLTRDNKIIARGHNNRDVAAELSLSPKTVGNHIEHIYSKIGVSTRAAATFFALQNGILETPER